MTFAPLVRGSVATALLAAGWALLVLLGGPVPRAAAQGNPQSRAVPRDDYFLSFGAYYDGDFNEARKRFHSAARGGVRFGDLRWIDSICYHTMVGECYYQLGDRAQALDQYTSALQLFLAHRNWMLRIQYPDTLPEASVPQLANITWGKPTRSTTFARFPDTMMSAQGQLDNERAVRQGGVVAPPSFYPVRVNEVVRCMALAQARRREIMGPVCEHDPLTNRILTALASRPAPPNHWSQAWVSVQLGLAYAAAGKKAEAATELAKGLQVAGRFDHPLTPIALVELGKLAFAEGKYDVAATMFYEATFPAVAYEQYDILEEAFRLGQLTHIVSNQKGVYGPLVPAHTWARSKGPRSLQASLLIATAENLSHHGDFAGAARVLDDAAALVGRREMKAGQIGARLNYELARVAFGTGKLAAGNSALAACMAFQKGGSRRLFQISLADGLYTSGEIRVDRIAELLYDEVLRDPTATDWLIDPMETMTVATTPHIAPMEHWFEVAVKRKQIEKAAEIADAIRRHRFYSTVPTGGRILSLRWILEAPESTLPERAKLQRRDLLAKYPQLDALSKESTAALQALKAQPLVPADHAAQKVQDEALAKLANISLAQELLISQIALSREPSEFVFPAVTTIKEMQQRLRPNQGVLAYFTTARYVVGFTVTSETCKMWQLSPADTTRIKTDLTALFKAWGHTDKNATIATADLRKEEWKPIATRLLSSLTNGARAEHFENLDELIIIPDGLVWYVPFEALQLEEGGATQSLISKVRIRYAPTLGLAMPDGRAMPRPAQTMIVAGRMHTKENEVVAQEAAQALIEKLPGAFVAPAQLSAPGSIYASLIDRLVVLDDIDEADRGPYDWSPLRLDKGKPVGLLSQWALLPWDGPQQVVLPGFHTPVEYGLKRGGTGDDVFLSVMGLMASGSRTILLSRWRTGGQTSYDLTREFVQELPYTAADNAWQRAVELVTSTDLDLMREPRVRASSDETLPAEHPFFWAGYLLIDTGLEPVRE